MSDQSADAHVKQYLATRQYRDASNLNARAALHVRYGKNRYPWFRWVFDLLLSVAPPDARILEVGAGPGGLWRENLDRMPSGWRVTLTDLSEGMVAQQRANISSSAFDFAQADIEALPFADASFDVAVANHMLYHVPDRPKALSELRRVMRPAAALIAATNGEYNMRELDDLIFSVAPQAATSEWRGSIRHPFTLENGADQLRPYFDAIEIRRYDDSLAITDADALVAYIRSIDTAEFHDPATVLKLDAGARHAITQGGGVFHITKSVGLFLARST